MVRKLTTAEVIANIRRMGAEAEHIGGMYRIEAGRRTMLVYRASDALAEAARMLSEVA